ncbi:MAG: HugZ family protein [bacterium]
MSENTESPRMVREYRAFQQNFRSLLLSTVDEAGLPEISYAPYVQDESGAFWLYLSDLARHTRSLKAQRQASVMFIENEQEAKEIFARTRLIFACEAEVIERDSAAWEERMQQFSEKFGELMGVLKELKDFHLFRLTPRSGSYVRGFAQAYAIEGEELDQVRHLRTQ